MFGHVTSEYGALQVHCSTVEEAAALGGSDIARSRAVDDAQAQVIVAALRQKTAAGA